MIKEKQLAVVNEIKDELATFLDGIKGRFDPSKVEEVTSVDCKLILLPTYLPN